MTLLNRNGSFTKEREMLFWWELIKASIVVIGFPFACLNIISNLRPFINIILHTPTANLHLHKPKKLSVEPSWLPFDSWSFSSQLSVYSTWWLWPPVLCQRLIDWWCPQWREGVFSLLSSATSWSTPLEFKEEWTALRRPLLISQVFCPGNLLTH